MFELLRTISNHAVPFFVVATMLNVGLTQSFGRVAGHLSHRAFLLKMLAANFIAAPAVMIAALHFAPFEPALKAGLLIFSMCAGAPFLIKLTQASRQDVSLGAAVMMVLMIVTILYVPIVLPLVLQEVSVDGFAIARSLLVQMVLPTATGMIFVQIGKRRARSVQPWVGRLSNVALVIVIAATAIGYAPAIVRIAGEGAILLGILFVLAAFGLGWLAGRSKDQLEDIGGLGTAQRNTAAGLIIASQNFSQYPDVLVIIVVANTLGIVILLLIAKALRRDNVVLPAFGQQRAP